MRNVDLTQIRTLAEYETHVAAIDAFLLKPMSPAEYEKHNATITQLVALKDYRFILKTLRMTDWQPREGGGARCEVSPSFWVQWRRDRIQIDRMCVQVEKINGKYALYTYREELVELLVSE